MDLHGRTVIPGFIDAHIHLLATGYRGQRVDASACISEDEVADLVRARAAMTPAGQWIEGSHWDHNLWPNSSFPTRASLDAAAPEHPVALASKDFHMLWVNSRALELAHITAETPDPAGGSILRAGNGEPTGVLQEADATKLIFDVVTPPDPVVSRRLMEQELAHLQSRGITTIHDIEGDLSLDIFRQLRDEQKLGVRVQMIMPRQMLSQLPGLGINNAENDLLRVGGIKIFADGTLGSQTAAMLDSFEGSPGNRGILALPEQEMMDTVQAAAELDLMIAIHAIGDRAARVALNSIEHAQRTLVRQGNKAMPLKNVRYRLEHVQLIAPEDLTRMRRLGVIASIQPFHAVADRDIAERYWGRRSRRAYAYRTMHDMGIPIAMGSDAPIETYDPLSIIYAATIRRDPATKRPPWMPDQALSIVSALGGYTLGAAYAGAEEQRKGSLTVGKLGDAVILRDDILRVDQQHLSENGVQATILGGNIVYGSV
ncbi:amidohydrolase [Dictyobacter vulcani]|uniref:amidohydrolase n=1 Tax=Dictyobacter vulcani TaxID=2607529 RepID=UPI001E4454BB|nr:amidohydrolase [Dictyobacter vulcani]